MQIHWLIEPIITNWSTFFWMFFKCAAVFIFVSSTSLPPPTFCWCSLSISFTNIPPSHSSFSQWQHSVYLSSSFSSTPVPHLFPAVAFFWLYTAALLNLTTCFPPYVLEMYQFTVSEGAAVGTPVGRVTVEDLDMGENTDVNFLIKEGGDLFKVSADVESQKAVVSIKKVQVTEFCIALSTSFLLFFLKILRKLCFTVWQESGGVFFVLSVLFDAILSVQCLFMWLYLLNNALMTNRTK